MTLRVNGSLNLHPRCLTYLILVLVLPQMPDRPKVIRVEEDPRIALA